MRTTGSKRATATIHAWQDGNHMQNELQYFMREWERLATGRQSYSPRTREAGAQRTVAA
jgi:hypothetical protein